MLDIMKEIVALKQENQNLKEEHEALLFMLDFTLEAVKKWGQEHGLIKADTVNVKEQTDKSKKEKIKDNMSSIFDALNKQ